MAHFTEGDDYLTNPLIRLKEALEGAKKNTEKMRNKLGYYLHLLLIRMYSHDISVSYREFRSSPDRFGQQYSTNSDFISQIPHCQEKYR